MKFISVVFFLFAIFLGPVQSAFSAEEVVIPFRYGYGQLLFDSSCASCHAANLTGTDKGPPLIHPFYKPSHHGDASIMRAGMKGVRAHHWGFGDMPPVAGMTEPKMKSIVSYIRFYQQAKGLY